MLQFLVIVFDIILTSRQEKVQEKRRKVGEQEKGEMAGPEGFDPTTCGSEDRRDILTTLRALHSHNTSFYIKPDRVLLSYRFTPKSQLRSIDSEDYRSRRVPLHCFTCRAF